MAWEVGTHGRSKWARWRLGLRVVTVEGAPIRFRHALVRALVGVVELWMTAGTVALLVAMGSRRFRRLGDHLAGTVVIRERSGTASARATRFLPHPGWESFADGLDVTRLSPEQYRLVRSYVLRAPELDHDTRWRIGAQILDVVACATRHGPPTCASACATTTPALALTTSAGHAYQRRFSPDPVFLPWLGADRTGAAAYAGAPPGMSPPTPPGMPLTGR